MEGYTELKCGCWVTEGVVESDTEERRIDSERTRFDRLVFSGFSSLVLTVSLLSFEAVVTGC